MKEAPVPPSGEARARLPAIDRVLQWPAVRALADTAGRALVTRAAREAVEALRASAALPDSQASLELAVTRAVEVAVRDATTPKLRPVINLTGTVLHTNLGRAVMPEEAVGAVVAAMTSACALEFDLGSGGRGDRDDVVSGLLCELTGAEAATVVNNNAAAVFLLLNTLAMRREVIVSRGELIEIGGAFRIPDIMARAGARLVEVGTTNRTHLKDFEQAIGARTALLMKVHASNYAITGFTAQADEAELAALAHARGLPLVIDLGSGTLTDLRRFGLPHEPLPQESIGRGADLVTFSGDKLLGGPQAGLVVGRRDLVDRLKKNPLKRALRAGKLTLAALEAVLRLYRDPDRLAERLTVLRLLTRAPADMAAQARRLAPELGAALARAMPGQWQVEEAPMLSQIGSGSLPVERLPSHGLRVQPSRRQGAGKRLRALDALLRALPLPVIGYVRDDALHFDLRCLEDEAALLAQWRVLGSAA